MNSDAQIISLYLMLLAPKFCGTPGSKESYCLRSTTQEYKEDIYLPPFFPRTLSLYTQ